MANSNRHKNSIGLFNGAFHGGELAMPNILASDTLSSAQIEASEIAAISMINQGATILWGKSTDSPFITLLYGRGLTS